MISAFSRAAVFATAAVLGLAACEISNPFTTAGSLRVEVEVYKGPLSKEPAVQWGELTGLIDEAAIALTNISDGILVAAAHTGALEQRSEFCETAGAGLKIDPHQRSNTLTSVRSRVHTRTVGKPCKDGKFEDHDTYRFWCASPSMQRSLHGLTPDGFVGCLILAQLHDDVKVALTQVTELQLKAKTENLHEVKGNDTDTIKNTILQYRIVLEGTSKLSAQLKAKALYWAETHASAAPGGRMVRNAMTNFANLASEYSNQLGSRADALLKQMRPLPRDRHELPLSVMLRDTEPTDFVNLLVWNRAAAPAIIEEMVLHPIHAFTSEETTDRVRVIERLFADYNWSKINTVFASGEGKTAIALIKDDIGNWNLKSFDSDPTELLNAYKDMTLAGIKAATAAITGGASGGALQSVLKTANSLTRGRISDGGAVGGLNIKTLHKRTFGRLEKLEIDQMKEEKRLKDQRTTKQDELDKPATDDKKKLELAEDISDLDKKIEALPKDTRRKAARIIEDHEFLINTLEQAVVAEEPKDKK